MKALFILALSVLNWSILLRLLFDLEFMFQMANVSCGQNENSSKYLKVFVTYWLLKIW